MFLWRSEVNKGRHGAKVSFLFRIDQLYETKQKTIGSFLYAMIKSRKALVEFNLS